MKIFTKNLIRFAVSLFIITIGFHYFLSNLLTNHHYRAVWFVAAIYGILIFIIGWFFGKKDKEFLPWNDIGIRWHTTTYIICNGISELWVVLGFASEYENIKSAHLTALYWGAGLLLHYIIFIIKRKNSIKGLKKAVIFE